MAKVEKVMPPRPTEEEPSHVGTELVSLLGPVAFRPPSATQQRKWAADSLARAVVRTDPGVKDMEKRISQAALKAAESEAKRGGKGGER